MTRFRNERVKVTTVPTIPIRLATTVRVPPKSKTIGELLGTYYRTNVSWTGRAKVYYNTGDFEERDISGVLNDVQASNFQANYIEG